MTDLTVDEVLARLREVPYPGTGRDIVGKGFVKDVAITGSTVFVRFAPNTTNAAKVAAMEDGIRDVLYGASFALVQVETEAPYDDTSMILGVGSMNPLQAEMLEDGVDPQPDVLLGDLSRAGANRRGQGGAQQPAFGVESDHVTDADDALAQPQGASEASYHGPLKVLQWEIDPGDSEAESVQRAVNLDGWEFRLWWQVHAGGELLYASLQALREDWIDLAGVARRHPVGRTEAVNLVYDRRRDGVVAIYGTVGDFRPFVEAFRLAYAAQYGGVADDGANVTSYGPGSEYGPGLSYGTPDEDGCDGGPGCTCSDNASVPSQAHGVSHMVESAGDGCCSGEGGCGCSDNAGAPSRAGMDIVDVARAAPAGEAEVRR